MTSTLLTPVRARPLHEDPRIHGRRWFLLAMMCLSLVLVVMSVSGLVTAIPTMQEELNASASEIQWILDAYAIVFAGSLLTAGALGDRFGRKRALLSGLVVFGVGVARRRTGVECRPGDRRSRGHGHRRRVRDAGDACRSSRRSSRPRSARGRSRVWAGFAGAGGAHRADRVRRAARSGSGGDPPCSSTCRWSR